MDRFLARVLGIQPRHLTVEASSLHKTLAFRMGFCFFRSTIGKREPFRGSQKLSEIGQKLKQIIVSQLSVEEAAVVPKAKFIEDLGADSLDIVELVIAMEEEFDIDIPDEEAENIRTVEDAEKFINKAQEL